MNTVNQTSRHVSPVNEARMARMEVLLRRYPGLTDDEMHELLHFVRKGPALELGLLTGNEELKPQLDRFRADHQGSFAIGRKEIAVIAALVAVIVLAIVLLWDAGGGR